MDDKEAHQIQLEENLCKERKKIISKFPDEFHNVAMQTIELETDLFNDLPCFVKGYNTSNVSSILVVEG